MVDFAAVLSARSRPYMDIVVCIFYVDFTEPSLNC